MRKLRLLLKITIPLDALERAGKTEAEARLQFETLADQIRESAPKETLVKTRAEIEG